MSYDSIKTPLLGAVNVSPYDYGKNDSMRTIGGETISEPEKPKPKPLWYRALLMAILVLSGASMTLCMKNQDLHCTSHCELLDDNNSNDTDSGTNFTLKSFESSKSYSTFASSITVPEWLQPFVSFGSLSPYFELQAHDYAEQDLKLEHVTTRSNDTDDGYDDEHDDEHPIEPHYFHQPFIQLFHLGFGQMFCGLFYPWFKNKPGDGTQPIPFKKFFPQAALASLFDVCAEVLIILGLSFTYASVTEMLKTTMVVFVGLLSIYFFPGFKLSWKQWVASAFMLAGSALVISQSYIGGDPSDDAGKEIAGAFLVIGAQLFYGLEFVVEEKLIDGAAHHKLHVNKAFLVFSLGILSMTAALILQIPWTLITSNFNEFGDELIMYFTTPKMIISGMGISLAVIGFDLAGLGISEVMGSDRRAISVAAFQVAIVWSISIGVGWEDFSWLSFGGFIIILSSGACYVIFSKPKSEPHQIRKKPMKNLVSDERETSSTRFFSWRSNNETV